VILSLRGRIQPEILAPAGTKEALRAAVRCGADAVYLGLERYSARANAQNFTIETLRDAIRYCHSSGVLLYVTLNTLLLDEELPEFAKTVNELCAHSIDAIIVQDIGVARLIHEIAPDLPMHASTQMSVQSLAGLCALAELGFNRAVLPRELSREELVAIIAKAPIECEIFVHGALCACLSGQCLMSAYFGGRSANRGNCAQPCRLPFTRKTDAEETHALSLKDLCLLDALPEMAQMGVASFKIEGRMKRPEYVAAAVSAYRQVLEGSIDPVLRANLRNVFSRSGFTHGYYDARRGYDMEGFRRKEDVTSAKDALPSLAALYAKEQPRFAVKFTLLANIGEAPVLSAELLNDNVHAAVKVSGKMFVEKSRSRMTNRTQLREQLAKCGGTPFYLSDCDLQIQENAYLPLSAVNALRREAIAQIETEISRRAAIPCDPYTHTKIVPHVAAAQKLHIRVTNANQIPKDLSGVARVILPLGIRVLPDLPSGIAPAVEIPRGIFGNEENVLKELCDAKTLGFALTIASGLDGASLAIKAGLPFAAGLGSNICNTQSLRAWRELGATDALISPELPPYQATRLGDELPRSLFAYGRLPLMLLRRCPQCGADGCADCSGMPYVIDRIGKSFPLQCHNGEYSELLACTPAYLADRQRKLAFADDLLLYFTDESPEKCETLLEAFREGKTPKGEYTRGLPGWK
jgi:putative protease